MVVIKRLFTCLFCALLVSFACAQPAGKHNLLFTQLASRWDEAIPLGNGMLGALVWQKNNQLRLSLDRADLWDERKALDLSKFNFKWVEQQVLKKDYKPVQQLGDHPYDNLPYPTKLPAAALQFNLDELGPVVSNKLDITTAINTVTFRSGVIFRSYIHATSPTGYFEFENLPASITHPLIPDLEIHNYNSGRSAVENDNSHAGEGLEKLGYARGTVSTQRNSIHYHQPTYQDHYFEVLVRWKYNGRSRMSGTWTITNDQPAVLPEPGTAKANRDSHILWWARFWNQSMVQLPDAAVEKQYYLELYKLGATSRKGAPAITLQAIWTADNGSLPPWKGDFHNDLNTQLSYWPAYTGNHLTEAATFTDWLWKIRAKSLHYTRQYFGVSGLNVPGVVTLNGDPMGGWIQYSLSPTVGAWCAQHFYWQWKYSMDSLFLKTRAYPYIHDAAVYLEQITRLQNGIRKLPLSSSPEYHDNAINAWFLNWTNYDLSLAKFLFAAAAEAATAMNQPAEAGRWQKRLSELPGYDVNETGLTVAPGENMGSSHRHHSPYMAIYPLALLDADRAADRIIIEKSLKNIEANGTRAWCGYSFSWMASLYARAEKADSALQQLQIFASNFCSPNSFHLNGDQKGGQYSGFTYRPFTLEGNFAFAQGVQELLLQSRQGYIAVFPSVPSGWKKVRFANLRAAGAFLVSGSIENGAVKEIRIVAEKGGQAPFKLPFKKSVVLSAQNARLTRLENGQVLLNAGPGGRIVIKSGE
ncbi:glycosyl hydrolase family 95 catalytic domain-containing protein [Niabella drilacis]|uniref:Alpha-L-fucosidase 2 n=1 Tax=Niabella drilacis (strain DSM 25811 / CCM 8410 / CCUG 62505 / LMG 26954 / E90) TaxID=1285928 RepID=A0A1G6NEU8_NIADE|nr:glycoside hydrolase N-terminal domain-containing protein [Niabella drilacis]SDC66390.1 alpha-L-fucosidase 2 [Niabella drilacis]